MTNELAQQIAAAAIRESAARTALEISEGRGQVRQARLDRTELSAASRALRTLIEEAED